MTNETKTSTAASKERGAVCESVGPVESFNYIHARGSMIALLCDFRKTVARVVFTAALLIFIPLAGAQSPTASASPAIAAAPAAEIWTCSMHPQIRMPKPGNCPICSMPLIRAGGETKRSTADEPMLELSKHARAMASVETVAVERRPLSRELRAVGKVQYNETALATVTSRVDGYIERLFVDFTGVEVKEGDHLVEIWSPDLFIAQEELFSELRSGGNVRPGAKLKLQRLGMAPQHVEELIRTRTATERVTLLSPITGTVTEKMVVQKSAVKAGDVLYKLANLESVWVYLDVYEYELPWVRYGQTVEITSDAFAQPLTGRVWFINPTVSDESRTIKVLINIPNERKVLKPGMFVSATIRAKLLANGMAAPTGVEGQWTCPMHAQILLPDPGACPLCKMPLVQIPGAREEPSPEKELVLSVPTTAVLDSGIRQIAYVERQPGEFAAVEVKVGPRAGDFYPVISGLSEGDRVAGRGNFLLDSQFQIRGLPSLFNKEGQAMAPGHQHGPAVTTPDSSKPSPTPTPSEHKGH